MKIELKVNGKLESGEVEARTLLVDFIRNQLKLTGTHVGCDTSQCGACTIHLNGKSIKSCSILAVQANGHEITTIEGVANKEGELHPMQEAFRDEHGLQCGFCTPGMIMSALAIVERNKNNDINESIVRQELEGNLCRCTGYHGIVKAIVKGATSMKQTQNV